MVARRSVARRHRNHECIHHGFPGQQRMPVPRDSNNDVRTRAPIHSLGRRTWRGAPYLFGGRPLGTTLLMNVPGSSVALGCKAE
ncbi:hypothetical protein DF22_002568 [Xylella fastidiosa]|nr:hypothetical protein DF22_002568 [Xylella fastidiosa]